MKRVPLPIDSLMPDLVRAAREHRWLVLEAPPGAGKTTRVPIGLLEAGVAGNKEIVVLQPRRLATRMAAARVADELGERVGETVGYQVRFEEVASPRTRLRFVTEGVLTRRLLSDPRLEGVGAVVLDEFHERNLAGDLALALLRRLGEASRPDLKLLVMSATLDAAPLASYFGGCPVLRSEGRLFPIALDYLPAAEERPLEQQVLGALKRLVADGLDGDVLVFLPGAAEIRRAREACYEFVERQGFELHALHGDLSAAEQDKAVRPSSRRKVILSTNVAETSVTIDGVVAVIDSGLARVAAHSPWSGLPVLKLAKVSRASAIQRAGRAGRTRPGRCLRLYTRSDFDNRPEFETPDVRRLDLTEAVLSLLGAGVEKLDQFPFFETPPAASLQAATGLLHRLGAVDAKGAITSIGRRLLRFPVHPRLGRVIVEAERRGVAARGAAVAALLGERDIRLESRANVRGGGGLGGRNAGSATISASSDVLEMLERLEQARGGSGPRGEGLDPGAVQAVERARKQISRMVDDGQPRPKTREAEEEALLISLLAGYPDRVARRRKPRSPEILLTGGGTATLAETSVVQEPELLVAIDAEERARGGVLVRIASRIEAEWLLALEGIELDELDDWLWNAQTSRVERVTRLAYGAVVLEETRQLAPPSERASQVLFQAVSGLPPESLAEPEALSLWLTRLELAAREAPQAGFPAPGKALLDSVVRELCEGRRSLAELREANFLAALEGRLSSQQAALLAKLTPARVTLPGGRAVRVNYEAGKPPWIESRLQDFFGMATGPSVCNGRVPLVLHLLAPNQRAVQVTTDLAGFWERHYPAIRKELARKYPRHAWPEDPRHATPPAPRHRG